MKRGWDTLQGDALGVGGDAFEVPFKRRRQGGAAGTSPQFFPQQPQPQPPAQHPQQQPVFFTPHGEVFRGASPPTFTGGGCGSAATTPPSPPSPAWGGRKRKLDALEMLSEMVDSVDLSDAPDAKRLKRHVQVHHDGDDVVLSVDKALLHRILPRFQKLIGYAMPPLITAGTGQPGSAVHAIIRMKRDALQRIIEDAYRNWRPYEHTAPLIEELDSDEGEVEGDAAMEVDA